MPIYTNLYIREQASILLDECNIKRPPVDVRRIAGDLGIEIIELPKDAWFYGVLTRYEDDYYIVVNSMMPETRKRFAIAHELGHFQMHAQDMGYQRRPDKEHYHKEADVFAGELLVPGELLKREALSWFNDHRVLADIFGVSEPLMIKRMEELNMISKGKFDWEYAHCKAV